MWLIKESIYKFKYWYRYNITSFVAIEIKIADLRE
jgi:hypothetical protein